MSRAARKPKTKAELESMTLDELNSLLDYLNVRKSIAGNSRLKKEFQKEIVLAEQVRESKFGVQPRNK